MGRRVLTAVTAVVVGLVLAACGVGPPTQTDDAVDLSNIKAAGHIADCVSGQTTEGGLPAYTLPCLGGGTPVALATLKGPLLVNLWQAQCAPCRLEMPALEKFYDDYGAIVPVLGIDSMDAVPRIALQTAVKRGVTFPLATDASGALQGTALTLHGFPTTFLLTADGTVKFVSAGGMKDEAEVVAKVSGALGRSLHTPLAPAGSAA